MNGNNFFFFFFPPPHVLHFVRSSKYTPLPFYVNLFFTLGEQACCATHGTIFFFSRVFLQVSAWSWLRVSQVGGFSLSLSVSVCERVCIHGACM